MATEYHRQVIRHEWLNAGPNRARFSAQTDKPEQVQQIRKRYELSPDRRKAGVPMDSPRIPMPGFGDVDGRQGNIPVSR